jgi:hypothetical protein
MPPEKLGAALLFAPVGPLVVAALKATNKGGVVVFGILVSAAGTGSGWLAWRQWRHKPEPILVEKPAEMAAEQSLKVVPKKIAKKRSSKA